MLTEDDLVNVARAISSATGLSMCHSGDAEVLVGRLRDKGFDVIKAGAALSPAGIEASRQAIDPYTINQSLAAFEAARNLPDIVRALLAAIPKQGPWERKAGTQELRTGRHTKVVVPYANRTIGVSIGATEYIMEPDEAKALADMILGAL